MQVTAQPLEGDTHHAWPDAARRHRGRHHAHAPSRGTPAAGEFQIGADVDATAANFSAALNAALTDDGQHRARLGLQLRRRRQLLQRAGPAGAARAGPTFATATALVTADPTTTVLWYKGEDAANARDTVKAKIDDTATVSYGAQANESGTLALMRSLATLVDPELHQRRHDLEGPLRCRRHAQLLTACRRGHNNEPGSIEMVSVELGNAMANVDSIAERQDGYKAQLEGLLEGIESVPKEDVAMEILALQTRLQASYQATSLVASLSLVNYLK